MFRLGEARAGGFEEIQQSGSIVLEPQNILFENDQVEQTPMLKLQFAVKRLIDVFGAFSALLMLSPLFGEKIRVYKFRSMRTDLCDATGVAQTVKNDPRVTKMGAILRKTNIDELPQLINVLKGDMSLVGPRCHAIGMFAGGRLYEDLVPNYHKRHTVRPGITGLAQMRGLRGPTDRADKARARIASDIYYVDNFSVWLDIKIIFGTLWSELKGGKGF
jgi:lipopolysaccharide/colanic/teichoic acid biosynthesis glycosyltransferase